MYDLPPKKWTQRRVGFSMIASSKTGGVQWKGENGKKKRFDRDFKVSAVKMVTEGWHKASGEISGQPVAERAVVIAHKVTHFK